MLKKVIVSNKIVKDALTSSFKFLENGQYEEAKKYLEYAKTNLDEEDQFLEYGLVISYYNLNEYENLKKTIDNLKKNPQLNKNILNTLLEIEKELNFKNNINEMKKAEIDNEDYLVEKINNYEYLQEKIKNTNINLQEIAKRTGNEFYDFLASPKYIPELFSKFEDIELEYIHSIAMFEKFSEYYYENEIMNPIKLHNYYNSSLKSKGHSIFMILGIESEIIQTLLLDKKIDNHLKNELICDMKYFYNKGYIIQRTIGVVKKDASYFIEIDKLTNVYTYILESKKKIEISPIYKNLNLYNYIMKLTVKFIKTHYLEMENIDLEKMIKEIYSYLLSKKYEFTDEEIKYFFKKLKIEEKITEKTLEEFTYLTILL